MRAIVSSDKPSNLLREAGLRPRRTARAPRTDCLSDRFCLAPNAESIIAKIKQKLEIFIVKSFRDILLICANGEVKIIAGLLYETKHNFSSCSFDIIA